MEEEYKQIQAVLEARTHQEQDTLVENTLNENIRNLEKECADLRNNVAVKDMLFDDLKERMREKYLYNDYKENDLMREKKRAEFRKKKELARLSERNCLSCESIAKSSGGLKTHIVKKHL